MRIICRRCRVLADIHNTLGAVDVKTGQQSIPAFEESARLSRLYLTLTPSDHDVRAKVVRAQQNQATMTEDDARQAAALNREACDEARKIVAAVPMNHRFNTMLHKDAPQAGGGESSNQTE